MRSIGLRFHAVSKTKRVVRAVAYDDTGASPTACFEHVLDGSVSQAQQARDARDWLRSTLSAYPGFECAILFEADRSARSGDTDTTRLRLRVEGALLTAALDHIPDVEVRNGKRLGDLIGGSKEAAITLGAGTGVDKGYAEAAAAALAAISLG